MGAVAPIIVLAICALVHTIQAGVYCMTSKHTGLDALSYAHAVPHTGYSLSLLVPYVLVYIYAMHYTRACATTGRGQRPAYAHPGTETRALIHMLLSGAS